MPITTFSKERADWWEAQGRKVEPAFSADGVDYWNIFVERDDKELTNPEDVILSREEERQYPQILGKRFAPVLHTVVVGNAIAATPGEDGRYSMPVSRSLKLLRSIFTKPTEGQEPQYKELKRHKQILNALKRMQESGVHWVSYYLDDATAESFDLSIVIPGLELAWKNYIVT